MTTEHLDQLLREAAGNPSDPAPSRRAIRAALGLKLAQRQRRDARARVARTVAIAAALLLVLCGPLGSDDFDISVESVMRSGNEYQVYSQGLRGEKVAIGKSWSESGRTEKDVDELLQQRAADEGILVGVQGFQIGNERSFKTTREYKIKGSLPEGAPEPSLSTRDEARVKAFVLENHLANYFKVLEISETRAPDFVVPMYIQGLNWTVSGWRITLPGKEPIIYYKGLRADGVRSVDGLPY